MYHFGIKWYHLKTLSDINMEVSDITLTFNDIRLLKRNAVVNMLRRVKSQ